MKEHDHVANAIVFSIESKIIHRGKQSMHVGRQSCGAKSARATFQPLPESCEISSNAIQIEIINRRTAIEKRFGRICIGIRREIVQPRNSSATTLATFVTEGEEGEERRGSSSTRSNLL